MNDAHRKKISLLLLFIMTFAVPVSLLTGGWQTSITDQTLEQSGTGLAPSETNLTRVTWRNDHIANGNMESWDNPHEPAEFSTSRTIERNGWYATAPEPVNEGLRSFGMRARAIDPAHPSQQRLTKSTWISWSNPANTTLKVDYYIDQNLYPENGDAFYLRVTMKTFGSRYLYYYLSGTTSSSNSSSYGYFILDAPVGSWNVLDRNLTADFIEVFGEEPTEFLQFEFFLRSYSETYIRSYIDDLYFMNGTDVIIGGDTNWGNFETTGSGTSWYWYYSDAADVVQSSTAYEGSSSANLTAASPNERGSQSSMYTRIYKRLSPLNPDRLEFQWRLDDVQKLTDTEYAYAQVECSNGTNEEFNVFYMFSYGESQPVIGGSGDLFINATGFNTTGTWHTFNRSVFEDITAVNDTADLIVERIEIVVHTESSESRISLLVDGITFESSILNDMSYEDQGPVGSEVLAWGSSHVGDYPELTVTDDAKTGSKAANLTLRDGQSIEMYQETHNLRFNNQTELYLDVNWKIVSFSNQPDEYITIGVYPDYGHSFGYVIANNSPLESMGPFDTYIIIPEVNMTGTWFNLQRDLYHDYEMLFGTSINDTITEVYVEANTKAGGNLTILFDDFYLYTDPAPELGGLEFTPSTPTETDAVVVTATAYDPSLAEVLLYYRVNNGSWSNVTMSESSGDIFSGSIPAQSAGAIVEFYLSASDTYNKTTTLMNGTDYFSYEVMSATTTTTTTTSTTNTTTTTSTTNTTTTTTSSPPPLDDMTGIILGALAAAVVIVIVYVVVLRPRQQGP